MAEGNVKSLSQHGSRGAESGNNVKKKPWYEIAMTFGARRPIVSFLLAAIITGISFFGAMKLTVDGSFDILYSKNDPGYAPYQETVAEFGSDNIVLVYFKDKKLFSKKKLSLIEEFAFGLEDVKYVEKQESLFTALNIRAGPDGLDMNPLMDATPETAQEIAKAREDALYSPIMRGTYISDDAMKTTVVVTLQNIEGDPTFNRKAAAEINSRLKNIRGEFEDVFVMGAPRINVAIERGLFNDIGLLTPIGAVLLVVILLSQLRTPVAAGLPLITAGMSILWTAGFMGFAGIPLNLLTAILPALVIVIGSTEDTHMLTAYLEGLSKDDPPNRVNAVRFMAVHVGLPIFITSFTTAVGFMANISSDLIMVQHFGITAGYAMVANLIVTILMLPLLLRFFGPRKSKLQGDSENVVGLAGKVLSILDILGGRYERRVVVVVLLAATIFAGFATKVQTSNDPLSFFKPDNSVRIDADILHNDLAGMQVFYLSINADSGKDFKDPKWLQKVDEIQNVMRQQGAYDKVTSIADYLKLVNQEMNQGNKAFYVMPKTRALAEQYLLLFARPDVERFINADATRANLMVRHNISNSYELKKYLDDLRGKIAGILGPKTTYHITSKNILINNGAETMIKSQSTSIILLVAIIFVLMCLLYTSFTAGFVSLVPNLIPVITMFGIMGLFGVPLNAGTTLVSVIAIGIAIDDTIHLLTNFNDQLKVNPDQTVAARAAVRVEAIPVVSTSLALAFAFLSLLLSDFTIIIQFGLLCAVTMVMALITDLLITPILLKRFRLVSLWDIASLKLNQKVLADSEVFKGMTAYQMRKTILLSYAKEFEPGEDVFLQGSTDRNMYVILSGKAEVVLGVKDGKETLLATLGTSEIFGEAAYAGNVARTATVRVPENSKEPLKVLMLEQERVASAMRSYPRIHALLNRNISAILAGRLANMGEQLSTRD